MTQDEIVKLMHFYDAHTLPLLVEAQAAHIESLQAKLRRADPQRYLPGTPDRVREG